MRDSEILARLTKAVADGFYVPGDPTEAIEAIARAIASMGMQQTLDGGRRRQILLDIADRFETLKKKGVAPPFDTGMPELPWEPILFALRGGAGRLSVQADALHEFDPAPLKDMAGGEVCSICGVAKGQHLVGRPSTPQVQCDVDRVRMDLAPGPTTQLAFRHLVAETQRARTHEEVLVAALLSNQRHKMPDGSPCWCVGFEINAPEHVHQQHCAQARAALFPPSKDPTNV
jgi:hypothetical protein